MCSRVLPQYADPASSRLAAAQCQMRQRARRRARAAFRPVDGQQSQKNQSPHIDLAPEEIFQLCSFFQVFNDNFSRLISIANSNDK